MTLDQMRLFLREAAAIDRQELRRMVSAVSIGFSGDEQAMRDVMRD
jgi:hypothetical protein